jgi:hypothetical protein
VSELKVEVDRLSRVFLRFFSPSKGESGVVGFVAAGLYQVPYAELDRIEVESVRLCRNLFPFTDEDCEYIKVAAAIAKGEYQLSFSGIYAEPGTFYMKFMEEDDFMDLKSISVLFGFYVDPSIQGGIPYKVQIRSSQRSYLSPIQLMFAPTIIHWNARILCAKLPNPWLKTPANSPFQIDFQPKGEYRNIKPIGITFLKTGGVNEYGCK